MNQNIRVLFSCTGVDVINRGIESFFREAFNGLKSLDGLDMRLLTGIETADDDEKKVWSLQRSTQIAESIGRITGRSSYAIEQISSFPAVVSQIQKFKPHVIFSSEANLFFLLYRFRRYLGVPYKLLYSNGGPLEPPYHRMDFVHQVVPYYKQIALAAGEPESKHIMVPYGIHVPKEDLNLPLAEKEALRIKLGLPTDRKIVISVGWISASLKRMDYTINEMAAIPPEQRPFLLLLGNIDQSSQEIIDLARQKLNYTDYVIKSVPYTEVSDYYRASDIFVLSSLKEGFGRVYLEALMHNLPVVAHLSPVTQYVIGEAGILTDLGVSGNLCKVIQNLMCSTTVGGKGRIYVKQKFDWEVLRPQYGAMFRQVAEHA